MQEGAVQLLNRLELEPPQNNCAESWGAPFFTILL